MDSNYWNKVYQDKDEQDVSWFQETPTHSLELIKEFCISKSDSIIDIGAGESRLVDGLIALGYQNISVLDISSESLQKMEKRLGKNQSIKYIVSNVLDFKPAHKFQLWHDRATFHFLTKVSEIEKYLQVASDAIDDGGFLIVSTFSKTGPKQCSGLDTAQYSEDELKSVFSKYFKNVRCFEDTHVTPWGTKQDFVYCGFRKY